MFQRFNALRERREGGFTLIELLVVILIIAILAAIAIPVFLNQRQKGWVSQSQSALKNAATAAETYATDTGGNYTNLLAETCTGTNCASASDLSANGFSGTANVNILVDEADTTHYCIEARHTNFPTTDPDYVWHYDSGVGTPVVGACV